MPGSFGSGNWNEYNLNPLTRNNYRASLVPAAAVIPAVVACIKVVAVKTSVVEFQVAWHAWSRPRGEFTAACWPYIFWGTSIVRKGRARGSRTFTLKKLECSKQAYA